ncbi:hypothetical protein CF386_06900 [Paraphotobacterium marinum]|uniref:GAF domain-containing protein n=1 Tax=Paraphotobacterium marinum TaxID=1755811 RepID=A0A220VEY2_9GAMM|nr:GAF domain-containing protein [Paraphotobacterium marinum]ASK78742.1 hypothetical protein CF386_06900 [Paraphotobacterium marinum]
MADYKLITQKIDTYTSSEKDLYANLSNIAAILYENIHDINWLGFYVCQAEDLVLGPFQGKAAVSRIKIPNGVCGMAAHSKKTILVDDVVNFEGHITCDCLSKSEIVIPFLVDNECVAVLDIDSPLLARFTAQDKYELEKIVSKLEKQLKFIH